MRQKLLAVIGILALLVALMPAGATAAPGLQQDNPNIAANTDAPEHPLGAKQSELKQQAVEAKLNGKAGGKK